MSKATKPVLTFAQFANDLGAHQRLTLAVSLVWHKQWLKATPQTRTALREEFMTHFTMGMLECTQVQAVRILTATISERTEAQHKAYMAASQKFKYHISRDGKKSKPTPTPTPTPTPKHTRLGAETREAAEAYLSWFNDVEAAIAALRAVAKK